jgi:hypothetical protein
METCKPIATPLQENIHYNKDMMPTTYEKQITMASIPYVNAIGSLMYIAPHIRLDMAFPIIHLAQFFVQSQFGALVWYKMPFVLSSSNTTYGHCPSHFNLYFLKVG